MNAAVYALRPATAPDQPVVPSPDARALALARVVFVAQRTLDDGLPAEEVEDWTARRDLATTRLLEHLDPAADEATLTAGMERVVMWLERAPRSPEHVLIYARTLMLSAAA
ncbi:hypothetical protein [Pseudactinotalea terrae]|uniref:hypothetical protein n=1 Tax=Pseudactinotalea terrae TaxID=1743262 RepID=UPI0012E12E31|nr:hypothetical protein [Pseudactinotalea terrae]